MVLQDGQNLHGPTSPTLSSRPSLAHLRGCWMTAMRSSTARAEAIMERPGLDTVHCWSSVLSRVDCEGVCVWVCRHADSCVTTTHISWCHHVTTEVTSEVITRNLGGQLTRRGGVRRNHTRGRSSNYRE